MKNIMIDLTKDNVLEQVEQASKRLNKKPWYKRLLNWI